MNINEILTTKDIIMDEYNTHSNVPDSIKQLSIFMADNYERCIPFIKYVRSSYSNRSPKCHFSLSSLSKDEIITTLELVNKLNSCGLLSDLYIQEKSCIHGCFSLVPKATNYLNGGFLEIYAKEIVERVLSAKSSEYNTDYELINNITMHRGTEYHEIDLLFRLSDKLFWCEVKSGTFSSFEKYYNIGKWLSVNPNMHILLSAEADSRICESASYFYSFYISDISNFTNKLILMIDNNMK